MSQTQTVRYVAALGLWFIDIAVIALAIALMFFATQARATALSDLAAAMQPGEWRELSTTGFNTGGILVPTGGAGNIIEYTDEVQRNPLTKKMYIIGCARSNAGAGNYQCGNTGTEDAGWVEFDENTNTWSRMPTAPTDTGFHTYDHAAIDPATGDYYFRELTNRVWKYSGGQWTSLPAIAPSAYDTTCCGGLEFFPERNELIFADGTNQRLYVWRPGQTSWSTVSIGPVLGDYEIFSEYSARRKVLYMGGGNGDDFGLVVMNEQGQLTRAASSPAALGQSGSVQSVDPNTGNLLLFSSDNQIYEYDPSTNSWASRGSHPLNGSYDFMAAAAPIPEYGVVFAVKYDFGNSKVYLYKHTNASATPAPTVSLSASSISVSNGGTSTLTWSSTNATSCTASNAWSGAKATAGTQTLTNLTATGTYVLSCTGTGGTAAQSVTIAVASATPAPTVMLSASSTSVLSGSPVTLSWSTTNASSCTASNAWTGSKSTSGSEATANLTATSTFTLTCSGTGGSGAQSVTVGVGAAVAPSSIAPVKIANTSVSAQSNSVVTFGHYFKAGDVPGGKTVGARRSDSSTVNMQVDVKARHADGSIKHAILTALVPSLGGSGSEVLTLESQSPAGGTVTPISVGDILATSFDAVADLNVGGVNYTASARALLQAGTGIQTWLSGPLVSEFLVGGPVRNGSTPHAHLSAYFHIRAYGKPVTRVRVDTVIENNWTRVAGSNMFSYVPTITVGGNVVYNNSGGTLNHSHHARWHVIGWYGSASTLVGLPDGTYLKNSRAIPNYGTVTPQASVFVYSQSYAPLTNADLRADWGGTGYHPQIGPMPEWDAVYAISNGDLRAYNGVLVNSSAGGSFNFHYRDETTGTMPKITTHTNLSEQGWTGGLVQGAGTAPYSHEPGADPSAHQPLLGYMAYLLTGDYYHLEELQFLANYNLVWTNARGGSAYRLVGLQNRGQAWGLRTLGHAAAITPDDHALKSYLTAEANYNIDQYTARWATQGGSDYNVLGAVQDYNWPYGGNYSPWQGDFFVVAYGQLVDLGFSNAVTMRDWLAKWPTGRLGGNDGTSGMCWYYATAYAWGAGISNGKGTGGPYTYYSSFGQMYQANYPTESQAACPTSGLMSNGAYPTTADAYYANLWAGLSYAVNAGVASTALWDKFKTMGTPNWSVLPMWNIVPRGDAAPTVPGVTITASPGAVGSGQSTTLGWSSSNATSCTASGAWTGNKVTTGTETIANITANSTFTLTCTGSGGSASQSTTVTVLAPTPTVSFSASATSVSSGGSSTFTWSSSNATSCAASASPGSGSWTGSKATSGTATLSNLTTTTTYSLACTGSGGTTTQNVTVNVSAAAPTVTLSASPASIAYNGGSTLTWSSTNATSCTASNAWSGTRATSGTLNLTSLTATGTYVLTCTGTGGSGSASTTITVGAAPAPTLSLSASATTVAYNGSSTLTWTTTNATSCTASGAWSGTKTTGSNQTQTLASLTSSGTYTLVCTGAGGSVTQSATVNVQPGITLSASPTDVAYNGTSVLTWSTQNATACTGSGAWSGSKGTSGSQSTGSLAAASTYTLSCSNASGASATASATVTVQPQAGMPSVTLTASASPVNYNGSTTLTWSSTNATTCTASGDTAWSGSKAISGSQTMSSLTVAAYTYTLSCSNAGGQTASQTVTVSVRPVVNLSLSSSSVAYNGSTMLTWTTTNATACTASNGWTGTRATAGNITFNNLTATTSYTLTCTNTSGASNTATVTVNVGAAPLPTATLSSNVTVVGAGGSVTLTWSSTNATACSASNGWTGTKAASGSEQISNIQASATYALACTGAGGTSSTASVNVAVTSMPPVVTLTANPLSVAYDGSSTLSWSAANAASCSASGAWSGTRVTSGTELLGNLTSTGTYTLTCTGPGGVSDASVQVAVGAAPVPEVIFTADTTTVNSSDNATLDWNASYADNCVASGDWSGSKPVKGKHSTPIVKDSSFSLTCTGPGGVALPKTVYIVLQDGNTTTETSAGASHKKVGGGLVDLWTLAMLLALGGAGVRRRIRC